MPHKYEEELEKIFVSQIMNGEIRISESNQQSDNDEFEDMIALLDSERQDSEYEWMSDIRIPEFASHQLTQSSIDVGQYFQTRDFVEVYLQDGSDTAKANSEAAKELINRTLNRKDLYHYSKFVRGKGINNIVGKVYAKCWWQQKTRREIIDIKVRYEDLDVDVYGNEIVDETQVPAQRAIPEPIYGDIPVIDRFNYDIWDQRNVFTDNSYVYSLQDKQFVTFRSEMTLSELEAVKEQNGYFNLDLLKDIKSPEKTDFKSKAADKDQNFIQITSCVEKPFDIYERYGKFWVITDKDEAGNSMPGTEKLGIDRDGKALDNATMEEVIVTIAHTNSKGTLIGFKLTPHVDCTGNPYRPIIRGICYIHLTEDGGIGDGKYSKELQIALDDTFNISQDRVMLATLPTLAVNKHNIEDNSTIYFEPGHPMELEDPKNDIHEFKISDNIVGALNQINMLAQKMQQVDSIQPPSMGDVGQASTTATAFAGASRATGERTNYKSLTFENTFLCDLYWMIQQMTFAFAKPETGFKLMGDKLYDFDPSKDYYYKPLSQSIESEQSKMVKRKEWATLYGYTAQLMGVHPNATRLLNYILTEYVKLMGDEHANVVDILLDENAPVQSQQGGGAGGMLSGGSAGSASNQAGLPMSGAEMNTRGQANAGTF